MGQVWGRPFGLIVGLGFDWAWIGEALVSREVGRMILRFAQNDRGKGGALAGQGRVGLEWDEVGGERGLQPLRGDLRYIQHKT
jgi:hypothetical protein